MNVCRPCHFDQREKSLASKDVFFAIARYDKNKFFVPFLTPKGPERNSSFCKRLDCIGKEKRRYRGVIGLELLAMDVYL